ncbi:membrane-associated tyrosine- and threonine-specific cdc2-inhibitory kinase [Ciconia boyciana]|uniref:membrane-associated tyrosine- and threonine-specific cdc2-inhibitory kinase n=1 Tax=Ciconia boyciana TaxID=52775 RepID=UPI003BA12C3C
MGPSPPPPSRLYDPSRPQSFFRQCFQVLGRLGRGSFGEVYKVRSREDGRLYAIKRTLEPFRGPLDRRRKLAEAGKHRRVGQHPHCLPLLWGWEERGRLYLQTHLCPAGSLRQIWGDRGLPVAEWRLWGYLWDLLLALRHLHARPLAHLDLKPANVLLAPGGCRLADFGVSAAPGETAGDENGGGGDPRYAAPEVFGGGRDGPGPPADVFSLALTLLELGLGERLPEGGEGWQELRRGGLPHGVAPGFSAELRQVLDAMLEPDPRRRPTAEELLSWGAVRRAGRWRVLTRLADEGLRRLDGWLKGCRLALRRLWGTLWGPAPWLRHPTTPPSSPLPPSLTPSSTWEEEEDEEEEEGAAAPWGRGSQSPSFASTPGTPAPDPPAPWAACDGPSPSRRSRRSPAPS